MRGKQRCRKEDINFTDLQPGPSYTWVDGNVAADFRSGHDCCLHNDFATVVTEQCCSQISYRWMCIFGDLLAKFQPCFPLKLDVAYMPGTSCRLRGISNARRCSITNVDRLHSSRRMRSQRQRTVAVRSVALSVPGVLVWWSVRNTEKDVVFL